MSEVVVVVVYSADEQDSSSLLRPTRPVLGLYNWKVLVVYVRPKRGTCSSKIELYNKHKYNMVKNNKTKN